MKTQFASALPPDWESLAAVFSALGDPYRQRILLMFEPGEHLTVKQLSDILPLSRTAVLHHVRALQGAGLLESVKQGREVFLSVNKPVLVEALRLTLDYAEQAL